MPGYGLVDNNQTHLNSTVASEMSAASAADVDVTVCPATHYGPGGQVNSTCLPCPDGRLAPAPGASNSSACTRKSALLCSNDTLSS
jgi:hypothetical protein